ncbi:hypothetical protein AOC36_08735 [Erysipelothrix larvae]|uniref:protein-tyrosine-phosphatase n=1 Tax=Erysipelothrix larvae TaxID=1514105 RepID=A0A0X8H140_9FIRM|nr:CpsB/CapC family capsule biosynthesis tyrosine phosphatase [Erysipelothrix larvae]AMC94070.1 hypothetical protein AOC36_08735 [Erysipelothrix larvae]
MIDLHTHILFGIDDGAKDLEESLALLDLQIEQGVHTVVLTPHYNPLTQELNEFLKIRDENYIELNNAIKKTSRQIRILKGAEVYYSSKLIEMDLSELVIENTDYILIEFPTTTMPSNIKGQLSEIQVMGYIPIVAHFERYDFFRENLQLPVDLINQGVLMQVNAESVLDKTYSNFIKASAKHNWIHIIGSDTHNLNERIPNIKSAMSKYDKMSKLGESTRILNNSKNVVNNEYVNYLGPTYMRKIFGYYF